MASGWDVGQKKVIRNNGRNTGSTIWNQDLVADQDVDALGHDTNDETLADSITETLNINGINAMLANLDVGGFKLSGVSDGGSASDGINKGQLDTGLATKIGEAPIDGNDYTRKDAAWSISPGGTNPNDIIVAQSWDNQDFISTRASGNFVTELRLFDEVVATSFKSDGTIRHSLILDNQTINISTVNRFNVLNDTGGGVQLAFTGLPSAADPDLGVTYHLEGSVTVWNGPTPGAITVSGLTGERVLGTPNATANAVSVLTYLYDYIDGGTDRITLIWSAEAP